MRLNEVNLNEVELPMRFLNDEKYKEAVRYLAQIAAERAAEEWEQDEDARRLWRRIENYASKITVHDVVRGVEEVVGKMARRALLARKRQRER